MKHSTEYYHKINRLRRLLVIGPPYAWFLLFLFIPVLFVLKISFAQSVIASPPYTDLVHFSNNTMQMVLNFSNYAFLFEHDAYFIAYFSSIKISFFTTMLCILTGYPIAYAIAVAKPQHRNILFALVILPYWTSFLLRAYAWTCRSIS